MPNTPLLGIPQVSASQNQKEITINDAIIALEAATNAMLTVNYTAITSFTLSGTQATRNMVFKLTSAASASDLKFPIAVGGNPFNRTFVVRNNSGQAVTVKFATGAGSTVVVPNGAARLITAMDGTDMIVAAEPATVVDFLSLTDTPGSYVGMNGKVVAVTAGEDGVEFIDVISYPSFTGNASKVLAVKADLSGVEWVAVTTSFTGLTQTPDSFTGQGGKLVAVNSGASALEFIDAPDAEAVEYLAATRWRILVVTGGTELQVGFGEIEFQNFDGIDQTGTGVASASTFATGKEADEAFNNSHAGGAGWLSASADVTGAWIEYTFDDPEVIRFVKLWPINSFPQYTPVQFKIQRHNGTTWVDVGEKIPLTWVSEEPQTFKVNGSPLSSVPDAPEDGSTYGRKDADWVVLEEGLEDAPSDGSTYGRKDAAWVAVEEGLEDAPSDGSIYGRKDGDWEEIVDGVDTLAALTDVDLTGVADGDVLTYDDADNTWKPAAPSGGGGGTPTETIIVALGDETTDITTGTAKVTIRMPYAFTLTGVRASLTTASSSGNPTVDINEGGASILSTKLSIDSGEKTSTTAATAAVMSDTALADDAEITFDIDAAGTGAKGLKVYLIGHQ